MEEVVVYYHGTDVIYEKYYKINGKIEGKFKSYHANEKIWNESNYVGGHLNGECFYYNFVEQLISKCVFVNDKIEGEYLIYYDGSNIKFKYNYINGMKEGKGLQYYPNGKIMIKCNYVNNELNGEYIEYDKNENIRYIKQYKDDKCIDCKNRYGQLILTSKELTSYVFFTILCDKICMICKI